MACRHPRDHRAQSAGDPRRREAGGLEGDAAAVLADESAEQAPLLRSPNQIEAVMANLQKRDPVFQD